MDNVEAAYELAPIQEGILFHSLLEPEAGFYVEQFLCTLHGQLDLNLFAKAWRAIVARHAVLRTSFSWQQPDQPMQRVHREAEPVVDVSDWRSLSQADQTHRLESFLKADRRQGFVFGEPPLLRLSLFRVEDSQHQFVWTFHHALLDGWSYLIVLKEIFSLYESWAQAVQVELKPIRPYRDYIASRAHLDLSQAQNFWRETLKGFRGCTFPIRIEARRLFEKAVLGSTGCQPAPSESTQKETGFGEQCLRLGVDQTDALRDFARQHRLTLSTLIQGAWAMLVSRYTAQPDVVFGATVCGRPPDLEGIESMVGVFINTLPVRIAVTGHSSVVSWLKELQARWIEFQRYEDTPLAVIRRCGELPADLPLFESIVVFENVPEDASLWERGQSLKIRNVRFLSRTHYPLTCMAHAGREMAVSLSYRRDCFEDGAVSRMLGHLRTLLEGITRNPRQRIRDLSPLTPEERQHLVVQLSPPSGERPPAKLIHEWFEAQAEKTPNSVAVVGQNQRLTYRELNDQASRLAGQLCRLGVGPEALVGLCVERSPRMLAALLGILKAGGAYLPLDPAYPQARLAFMITDSQAKIVLTERKQLERLPPGQQIVLCLEALEPTPGAEADVNCPSEDEWSNRSRRGDEADIFQSKIGNPKSKIKDRLLMSAATDCGFDTSGAPCEQGSATHPENLAYVLYTSGSTGQPKGVSVEHRNVAALMAWVLATFAPEELQGVLASTSLCFDLSVFEIFAALGSGGKVILADNLLHLPTLPAVNEVTLINTVPSAMTELLRLGGVPPSVRTINLAGEPLSAQLVRQIYENTSVRRVFDLYGPTEDTVYSTAAVRRPDGPVTIGRSLAYRQAFILDAGLQPVPIGVPGELFLAGRGLSRGYLHRPELTAERFIPNPFAAEPGARLYRTGDSACGLPGGDTEFLGRKDHQIKLRGHRIELGEIEAALREHPAVREAVAAVCEPGQSLVGYVVLKATAPIDLGDLRRFVADLLPAHMVPASFVVLDAIPRTLNGKADRRALPAPQTSGVEPPGDECAVRTDTERILREIWRTVLGIDRIKVNDNFFELGGHSLLVTRVIARVRSQFQIDVPLRVLFECPTIASLASEIERLLLDEARDVHQDSGKPARALAGRDTPSDNKRTGDPAKQSRLSHFLSPR
ncbi:MAG: amino acid adenylation domain-containing protein [Verrucomicrobia bacterium]|nr:amino acid adenylation domain-containing protein [Verrucomicrobiota bacterium]